MLTDRNRIRPEQHREGLDNIGGIGYDGGMAFLGLSHRGAVVSPTRLRPFGLHHPIPTFQIRKVIFFDGRGGIESKNQIPFFLENQIPFFLEMGEG